ncbi:MAG: nucleotide exchange factor GrpE [Lachnospiraceae bacterium]|nr:nucleotide exchange factor GrpE [Lachnospiraceae bacterium]
MAETNTEEVLNQEEVRDQDTVETEMAEEEVQQEAVGDSSEAADTDQNEKADKKGFFKKKKDKKDEQIEELSDRLKRNMAEFDNFRKRTEKEKAAMFEVGAKSVIEKILPVVDNFERGLATVPEEEKETPFVQGMDKTYKHLMKMLEEMEVAPIESVGREFDPAFHNAVMHVDDENAGDNIVVEEFQKGYTYRGNVVRFSMVKVAN